ncbi:MAG: hypothetical protein M3O32_00420, partial [Actinomycetota bacterium]|nr:hypothetical protein [Actinomycetota bacterium]
MIGPFSFFGPASTGARHTEHVFYHLIPTHFGVVADVEIKGHRRGKVTGVQLVDVREPSALNGFCDPDGDLTSDREPPLPPGSYVRFAYRPDDTGAAQYQATTEVVTVTFDDGEGGVITSAPQTIHLPALGARRGVGWGPRSSSVTPSGLLDVTRLDAFAGSTYLPTGEVVFDVFPSAHDGPGDVHVTTTQPAHGTVVAVGHRRTTDDDQSLIRLVYTPHRASRIDPWIHADEFTVRVGDDSADVATVPVVIAKRADVIGADELPYLG